ncbi:MAG TPA: methionyl-tRNA formyltransferase [Thermodesulfobacteriota bacterium]|nr:methionyl-tRNA formyltransferase [Thermodesulfobacteriota bacterium]
MRIVFMGTPEFAVPSLKALAESRDEVAALVAQPDKPKGRGLKPAPPPTKIVAEQFGIPVLQPSGIRTEEFLKELAALNPDLICVAAYGKILPKAVLELPRFGCLNVHASLLPKYRGAAPVNWAIARGEKVTGITIMEMDEGMDTGDILLTREIPIDYDDTGETLTEKLSLAGAELLLQAIAELKKGYLQPLKQDETAATYAPMLKKKDGRVDWRKPAGEIRNQIRGMLPWPGAYTYSNGKMIKIYKAAVAEGEGKQGEVVDAPQGVLRVMTGEGALDILELQLEGGKRLDAKAFLSGRRIEPGAVLG